MMNEPVATIMTHKLITADPEDSVSVVYDLLTTNRIHHVPIVKGTRLEGLMTTYDLFKLAKSREELEEILVKEVMTTQLATLESTAKVGTAAQIFLENLFHALPIVDGEELVGIVTTFDILRYSYNKEYPNEQLLK